MSTVRRNAIVLNLLVIAVTIVFVATALILGRPQAEAPPSLSTGDFATERFEAPFFIQVEDVAATEDARIRASNNVRALYELDLSVNNEVDTDTQRFFLTIETSARLSPNEVPDEGIGDTTLPPEDTTPPDETTPPEETTSTEPPDTTVDGDETTTTSTTTTTTIPESTTTTLPLRSREEHLARVGENYARLRDAVEIFVDAYRDDVERAEEGLPLVYPRLVDAVQSQVTSRLDQGIIEGTLDRVKDDLAVNPPQVFLFLPWIEDPAEADAYQTSVDEAVAEVVSDLIQENQLIDEEAWEQAQQDAADAVDPVTVEFFSGEAIVEVGSLIGAVELDALRQAGHLEAAEGDSRIAVAAVGALAVVLAAFFLWRIAPSQWSEPRRFALLGVLLVLAALVSRIPELITQENEMLAYAIPAVMFGYMAAILYDPRTAVLMSVPMAAFTAISTGDAALTLYAAAATVAPVAFVSSVSSRRDLRVAVAFSAAVLAPLAAAIAWLFTGSETAWEAAMFAVLGGLVAGLVAQGLLSFLENLFRVTTTITLLDLTDRNHPALRLIEEEAPGTFNHSILVGTLAGKAARAIGADPLLAQATAFYHDLGKTKQPQYFIENQFGVSNPHDLLPTQESAEIISDHVTEGLRLAKQYRLPTEVVDGIRMHHGTGLMRYFYHKAMDEDPGVDPSLYRHRGEKPKRKETAILMISDACEGAARAMAQHEDPTGDSLRKLVDSIVGEKLEDGQLDESDLTFGDLTKVKHAIVEALIGYYHTRIPYPGFPGPRVESP